MLVIGEKEVQTNTASVRSRIQGDIGQIKIEEFEKILQQEIKNHVK